MASAMSQIDQLNKELLQKFYERIVMDIMFNYFELKILDKETFKMFLETNLHTIFHKYKSRLPCCECLKESLAAANKKDALNEQQFHLLYEISSKPKHNHELRTQREITQCCLCIYSPKGSVSLLDLDIFILIQLITTCRKSYPGSPKWFDGIRDARNIIYHQTITEQKKTKLWNDLEVNSLHVARTIGEAYGKRQKMRMDEMKADNEDIERFTKIVVDGDKNLYKLVENSLTEIGVKIDNLLFRCTKHEIQTEDMALPGAVGGMDIDTTDIQGNKKCRVAWKVINPGNWNMDMMVEKLKCVSCLSNYEIEFIYQESIVIITSTKAKYLKEKCQHDEFEQFFKSFASVVGLDTFIHCTVDVTITCLMSSATDHYQPGDMSAQTNLSDGANDQLKNEGISNVNIDSELRDAGAISSCPTYKDDWAELRDCDESVEVHNKTVELTTVEVKNNQILEGIQNGTTSNITGEVPYESTEAMIKGSMNIDDASVSNCMTAASRNVGGSDSTYNLTKPNDTEIVSNDLYDKSRTQPDAYKIVFNEAEFSADKSIDTVILDEKDDSTISVECEITRRETPDGNEGSYPVLTESGEVNNFILNDNKSSTMSVEYENTSNVNKNNTIQDVPGVQIQNQNDRTKNQDRQYDTKSPGKNDIKGTGHRKQFEGTSKKLNGESTQNDNKQCNNSNTITETERILGDIASGALSGQRVDDDLTKGNKSETRKKMNDSDCRPVDQDKKSEIVASSWKKNTPNENVFQFRATASSLKPKIIRRTKSIALKTKMPGENLPNNVRKEHSSEAHKLTTGTKAETLPKYESTDHLQNDRDDEPEIVVPLSERIKQNSKKDIYWSIDKLKNVTKKLDGITNWSNKVTPCPVHKDILSHWCSTCKKAKCEKCLNILYSKSCVDHSITTLENHVTMREKDDKALIKEKSSLCLKVTDQTMENLSADYQNSELLALTQEERIKQEFISFHALLVEKENDILTDLRQSFEQYKVQNSMGQSRCGDFIVEEAELARKLDDKESNLLSKIKNMDTLMDKWSLLQKKTVSMAKIPFPSQLRDRFTLFQEKTYIEKHLSVFSDPLELHPTHSTVFLSGSTLESPLRVSDLFECKNSTYSFDDIEVDVEICQSRKLLQYLRLRMNEDVFNSNGRVHLIENTRYLVRARLVADGVMNDNLGKRFRNVFIVTGCRGKCNRTLSTTEVIHYMEKLRRKKNKDRCPKRKYILYKTGLKPLFYEWQKTGMWSLSCTRDCKDFFDISPEELRVLAYSVDKATYDSIVVCFEDDLKNDCQHLENSHFSTFRGLIF